MPKIWQREWWFPPSRSAGIKHPGIREMVEGWERNERDEKRRKRSIALRQWRGFFVACVSTGAVGLVLPTMLEPEFPQAKVVVIRWVVMSLVACGWAAYHMSQEIEANWWANQDKSPPYGLAGQIALATVFGGTFYLGVGWVLSWPLFILARALGLHLDPL